MRDENNANVQIANQNSKGWISNGKAGRLKKYGGYGLLHILTLKLLRIEIWKPFLPNITKNIIF